MAASKLNLSCPPACQPASCGLRIDQNVKLVVLEIPARDSVDIRSEQE